MDSYEKFCNSDIRIIRLIGEGATGAQGSQGTPGSNGRDGATGAQGATGVFSPTATLPPSRIEGMCADASGVVGIYGGAADVELRGEELQPFLNRICKYLPTDLRIHVTSDVPDAVQVHGFFGGAILQIYFQNHTVQGSVTASNNFNMVRFDDATIIAKEQAWSALATRTYRVLYRFCNIRYDLPTPEFLAIHDSDVTLFSSSLTVRSLGLNDSALKIAQDSVLRTELWGNQISGSSLEINQAGNFIGTFVPASDNGITTRLNIKDDRPGLALDTWVRR